MSEALRSPSSVPGRRPGFSRKRRRLIVIGMVGSMLAAAAGLVLVALSDRITFFRSPSEIVAGKVKPGEAIRLGGLVVEGSISRAEGQRILFQVTDGGANVPVEYVGLMPDLFREGQGVVAEGRLDADGRFRATSVLAKHDEAYMPREVADALKKQGHWQPSGEPVRKP